MDNNPLDDQNGQAGQEPLPQPMGRQTQPVAGGRVPTPPGTTGAGTAKPGGEAQDVAAIERQEKIDRLRTREDDLAQYDDEPPRKRRRFLRFLGWMLVIVLLTGAGAAAGWYYWLRNEPKPAPKDTGQSQQTAAPPATSESEAEAEPTEHHNSTAFKLQFDYLQTWKVTEGDDNKIIAVSPATQLKTAGGETKTGQILFTVRHKQSSLPEYKEGNALAVIESEKIDYAKPSQVQRASTYLSFLNYAGSTAKGIDGVYVTGDSGYVKDQYIPLADITKGDPLITVTFRGCADDKCATAGEPLTLDASAWQDESFSKPIRTMLESIIAE